MKTHETECSAGARGHYRWDCSCGGEGDYYETLGEAQTAGEVHILQMEVVDLRYGLRWFWVWAAFALSFLFHTISFLQKVTP